MERAESPSPWEEPTSKEREQYPGLRESWEKRQKISENIVFDPAEEGEPQEGMWFLVELPEGVVRNVTYKGSVFRVQNGSLVEKSKLIRRVLKVNSIEFMDEPLVFGKKKKSGE